VEDTHVCNAMHASFDFTIFFLEQKMEKIHEIFAEKKEAKALQWWPKKIKRLC